MADFAKLPASPFSIEEAKAALKWPLGTMALAHQLSQLGFTKSVRGGKRLWTAPPVPQADCGCRCHTGTCGANAMLLAERTLRVVLSLRPMDRRMIEDIERIVDAAGVDFARTAIEKENGYPLDADLTDEVPF